MSKRGKIPSLLQAQQFIKIREKEQSILQQQQKIQQQQRQQQQKTQQKQPQGPITPVVLDSSTALKVISSTSMFNERALMGRNDTWHKVQISRGGKFDMEFILKSILNAIHPADLIPVRYQILGEDSFFLARNCGPALEKLCQTSLIINDLNGEPLILTITLGFASIHDIKINIQPLLISLITKRHDTAQRSIYLDSFHKDVEISRTVYCPLTQSRTFTHVLKLIKTSIPLITGLSLRENELTNLTPIESVNLNSLQSLDLRNNKFLMVDVLAPLRNYPLRELWLDGNPLCENYSSPEKYIESVKKYCPNLVKLDGVLIQSSLPNAPVMYQNYIKSEKKKPIVDQFVSHFFTLYDQRDRSILRGIYHEDAMFSMTLDPPPSKVGRQNLLNFISNNRNILNINDFGSCRNLLFQGHDCIIDTISRYPPSQHVKKSFTVDLMFEDSNFLMICVEGLFKNLDMLLGFNRTFVIVPGDENEYNIMNDQLHIYFLQSGTMLPNFAKFDEVEETPEIQPACLSEKEKEELVDMFCEITTMNVKYCQRHLEDIGWDIRKAVQDFMYLYKNGCVPPEAFIK